VQQGTLLAGVVMRVGSVVQGEREKMRRVGEGQNAGVYGVQGVSG
jgi:hypothetical protein